MRVPPAALVLALPAVLLCLVPLGFVVVSAAGLGADGLWALVGRARTLQLLQNTAWLTAGGMLACAVIGTAAAWAVERSDLPLRRLWHVLFSAPLAVPAFVSGTGWVSLAPRLQGGGGALFVVTLAYYPLVYLPVAASLRGLDPALEEVALSHGRGRLGAFATVVLPQLRPALLGGTLLVGLHLLAEFGAISLLRFETFTTAIYGTYQSSFNGPAASGLASVLVLGCLVLLLGELRSRGSARYARIGAGARRSAARVALGPQGRAGALVAAAVLAVAALGVPLASLVHWALVGASTSFPVGDLARATLTSVALGAGAAAVTSALALPVAWARERRRGRAATALERGTYFGSALPGIVVALAFITVTIRYATPLYQTTTMLLLAYAILFIPRATISQRAALAQVPPVLDDVAASLGAGGAARLARVVLPVIGPGVAAGAALVFLAVVTELTATLLLAPIGTATLATRFWNESSQIHYGAAAPYAALMILISAPATWLLIRHAAQEAAV